MDAIKDFLDMSGYGAYIWPCYLISAGVMGVMLVASLRLLRANEATIKTLETSTKEEAVEKKT